MEWFVYRKKFLYVEKNGKDLILFTCSKNSFIFLSQRKPNITNDCTKQCIRVFFVCCCFFYFCNWCDVCVDRLLSIRTMFPRNPFDRFSMLCAINTTLQCLNEQVEFVDFIRRNNLEISSDIIGVSCFTLYLFDETSTI